MLSCLNAVISTNERNWILTGHVTFKLRYNQIYQLKTTLDISLCQTLEETLTLERRRSELRHLDVSCFPATQVLQTLILSCHLLEKLSMRNMVLWPNMLLGNIDILHQQNNWLGGSSLVVQLGRAPDNLECCSVPCHGFYSWSRPMWKKYFRWSTKNTVTELWVMETGDRSRCDPETLCIQTYHVIC